MNKQDYQGCVRLLRQELVPAFGCTEPIAIAYAAARAKQLLGCLPERMQVLCSGNIIKNVKGVVVPATGNRKGIEIAAIIGAVAGDADSKLEVLHHVTDADRELAAELLKQGICTVGLLQTSEKLHIQLEAFAGEHRNLVELKRTHTGIVREEKDDCVLFASAEEQEQAEGVRADFLSFEKIFQFANEVDPQDVQETLERQIRCNTAIADAGLTQRYGAGVGRALLDAYGKDVRVLAKALPAAGSDARMGGCELPVVINSGSGNQGMTVSLPVIAYAQHLGVSRETLYRALCVSNLTALYQKEQIGRLSAFCGAVSAGAGAGAGIAYLRGADAGQIAWVVSNTLANVAGIICDGAKASCAAKIASSVEAALLAIDLMFNERDFEGGDGIVQSCPDKTVEKVAEIAREGMRQTDEVILKVMIGA